jgi:hypothetical protein
MVRLEKSNGLVFATPDVGPTISVLSHEDVEGGFQTRMWLASLILLPSANFWIFELDHPRLSLFSYDNLFAFSRFGMRWPKQDLPIELNRVHVSQERVFIELYLGTLYKLQSSCIYGRLNLLTKNIAIVSTMRIRIMPFTICMLFQLFRRRYNMITWQLNLFFLQQVIKYPITLSDVESKANLIFVDS